MGRFHFNAPLDPSCPDNPMRGFYEDSMTDACGCADEIAELLETRHRKACKRCQEYGAENIEVVD